MEYLLGVQLVEGVILGFLAMVFMAMIGCYCLVIRFMNNTSKKLGDIYRTVNDHVASTEVHVDPAHPLVTGAVCEKVQALNFVEFKHLKDGQDEVKAGISTLNGKIDKVLARA